MERTEAAAGGRPEAAGRGGQPEEGRRGGRPLLLLHGFGQSARTWDEIARLIGCDANDGAGVVAAVDAESCRAPRDAGAGSGGCARVVSDANDAGRGVARAGCLYAIDWPGFGARRGDRDPELFSLEALCDLTACAVRAIVAREGVAPVVVGYSMGGRVAFEALVRGHITWEGERVFHVKHSEEGGCCETAAASEDDRLASGVVTPCRAPSAVGRVASGDAALDDGHPASGVVVLEGDRLALDGAAPGGVALDDDRLAAGGPAPIAGLVLESAGLGPRDEEARAALATRNATWADDARSRGTESFMAEWAALPLFASQRELPAGVRDALAGERAANDAEALALALEGSGAHRQSCEAASLAALAAAAADGLPVLYVAGDLDGRYREVAGRVGAALTCDAGGESDVGVACGGGGENNAGATCDADDESDARPTCGVVVVPRAGHNVHLEQPEAFARVLRCFLCGLPGDDPAF